MIKNLFGYSAQKSAHYFVFHDESEPTSNKGWLLIGLLFVKEEQGKPFNKFSMKISPYPAEQLNLL